MVYIHTTTLTARPAAIASLYSSCLTTTAPRLAFLVSIDRCFTTLWLGAPSAPAISPLHPCLRTDDQQSLEYRETEFHLNGLPKKNNMHHTTRLPGCRRAFPVDFALSYFSAITASIRVPNLLARSDHPVDQPSRIRVLPANPTTIWIQSPHICETHSKFGFYHAAYPVKREGRLTQTEQEPPTIIIERSAKHAASASASLRCV